MGVPTARRLGRTYPKPPAFLPRFVMLLLKPESWAAAAQYPFWVTLLPLVLAVVIASGAVAMSMKSRFFGFVESFTKEYDKHYPVLQVNSDGEVTAAKGAVQPFDFDFNGTPFVVDTTGKTSFEAVKGDTATLITKDKVYQRVMGQALPEQNLRDAYLYSVPMPGSVFVPSKGEAETVIDGAHIAGWVAEHRTALGTAVVIAAFLAKFLAESIWVAVMAFLLRPTIMIGAAIGERRLVMPKRALYRIAAALLVPVVVFAGVMQAFGYSMGALVGPENGLILWYFACAAMGLWAGHLAQQMYMPPKSQGPRAS